MDAAETLTAQRRERLAANVTHVRGRMAEAARRSGREPEAVQLITVTKSASLAEAQAAVELGCTVLGENRVQVAAEKVPHIDGDVTWHLIGHLQRNKARKALELVETIQSVDSERLAATLERIAGDMGRENVPILVEVNMSGEAQKHGVAPEGLEPLLAAVVGFPRLTLRGLMTMAPHTDDKGALRRCFVELRELRERLAERGYPLPELSMGMTNDYEIAIEEGATLVRIGSALFATT